MPWAKFDDNYTVNTKVNSASATARLLHLSSIVYCARNLNDGYFDDEDLARIIKESGVRHVTPKALEELFRPINGHRYGLWERHEPGTVPGSRKQAHLKE